MLSVLHFALGLLAFASVYLLTNNLDRI